MHTPLNLGKYLIEFPIERKINKGRKQETLSNSVSKLTSRKILTTHVIIRPGNRRESVSPGCENFGDLVSAGHQSGVNLLICVIIRLLTAQAD